MDTRTGPSSHLCLYRRSYRCLPTIDTITLPPPKPSPKSLPYHETTMIQYTMTVYNNQYHYRYCAATVQIPPPPITVAENNTGTNESTTAPLPYHLPYRTVPLPYRTLPYHYRTVPLSYCTITVPYITVPYITVPYHYRTLPYGTITVRYHYRTVQSPYRTITVPYITVPYHSRTVPLPHRTNTTKIQIP